MRRFVHIFCLLLVACVSIFAQTSSTAEQVPRVIRFSGIAKDESGKPMTGTIGMTFCCTKTRKAALRSGSKRRPFTPTLPDTTRPCSDPPRPTASRSPCSTPQKCIGLARRSPAKKNRLACGAGQPLRTLCDRSTPDAYVWAHSATGSTEAEKSQMI